MRYPLEIAQVLRTQGSYLGVSYLLSLRFQNGMYPYTFVKPLASISQTRKSGNTFQSGLDITTRRD